MTPITKLGLGTWALGGPYEYGWGPVNDDESIQVIKEVTSKGINWLDTAPAYGTGHAERIVGRALRSIPKSDQPEVFTKVGRVWKNSSPGEVFTDLNPKTLRRQVEQSLNRLQLDQVSCLQIHRPDRNSPIPIEVSWERLAELSREGYSKSIGLCNVSVEEYRRCSNITQVHYVQLPASLIRPPDLELLNECAKNQTRTLAFSTLGSGLLTGKFALESLDPSDFRLRHRLFSKEYIDRSEVIVQRLRAVANELKVTIPEVAIAWTLSNTKVSSCIVGARSIEQLKGWCGASDLHLTEEQCQQLETMK